MDIAAAGKAADSRAEDVAKPDTFDGFFAGAAGSDIQDFIDEEAEKFRKSSELFARSGDDAPEPPKGGGKKNPLSDFFSSIGSGSDDTFFDDVEGLDDSGKMAGGGDITLSVPSAEDAKREDNVVFLAGSLGDEGKGDRQIDLMEMIRKMEETLEIPAIFKKK
jgi:hypothetical protein